MRRTMHARSRPPRLLVMSYYYPPDDAVGGNRWAGISKYLARLGWDVHVVTAAAGAAAMADVAVSVYSAPRRRTLNDAYAERSRGWRTTPSPSIPRATVPPSVAKPAASSSLLGSARKFVGRALAFPDQGRGWNLRAAALASALLREWDFDAIITTGPPHSTHLAGSACSMISGVPHVVDMRDPWIWESFAPSVFQDIEKWMERRVASNARALVSTTQEFQAALREKYPTKLVSWIPNGADLERIIPAADEKFPGLSIAYAGTVYVGRDLSIVVRAMNLLFANDSSARAQCTLRIAGSIQASHELRFKDTVAALGLRDSVVFLGEVPREDALEVVRRSHLAIVLAQHQRLQVPAKLYECVALGIPTLTIAEAGSATAREATRLGVAVCSPNADADVAALLGRIMHGHPPELPKRAEVSYETIAGRVSEFLLALSAPPDR